VEFVDMLAAYRRSGGLASGEEVLHRSQRCRSPAAASEPRQRTLICFQWAQKFWLPWFQFDRVDMSLRPGLVEVIAELAPEVDGWGTALWFARPNRWIANARPVDVIDECLPSVLAAARADRPGNARAA
jgi:hypothetical protein